MVNAAAGWMRTTRQQDGVQVAAEGGWAPGNGAAQLQPRPEDWPGYTGKTVLRSQTFLNHDTASPLHAHR